MNQIEPIAVVAMAGVFPEAPDLDVFWHNLVNRIDAVGPVPPGRWIAGPEIMVSAVGKPDRAYSDRACLIRDFSFDPTGYSMDADLLADLDPVHHLALDTAKKAYAACQTAGLVPERTATILAAIALPTDASSRFTRDLVGGDGSIEQPPRSATALSTRSRSLAGRVTGLPAALVSRALGLGGGSLTLDAACASSLYAVKLACDELQAGRVDAVVTGGVSRPDCLFTQVGFSQLRALSPSGRCAPFDATADGLVVGEGAGILILKRLDDAVAAGDTIWGVIRGMGLSNDMRGNLLAPDTHGQLRAMRAAYAQAGWSPDDVDLIECHGTGTLAGDRTELQSMIELWRDLPWTPGQCAIGSVKSGIGHLLTAAGAAGMIKALLAMNRSTLPPSLNFTRPGPNSPLPASPFRVQQAPEPWRQRTGRNPRRAAVNAFGFGGINAHLLLEQWTGAASSASKVQSSRSDGQDSNTERITIERKVTGTKPPTVAVVGMAARFGPFENMRTFEKAFFSGTPGIGPVPGQRWRGCDDLLSSILGCNPPRGAYLDALKISLGEFRIPPNEIPDILIQHLLMLQVAAAALADANLPLRETRPAAGVVVGMEFDMEATDFHLRWHGAARAGAMGLSSAECHQLQDDYGPPLTAPRTLGALGGIIASRMAREFGFGGPSFTVSNEAASGLRAMEIGLRALELNQTDTMLICAVDLPGDLRRIVQSAALAPLASDDRIHSLDPAADGTLPGEGAAALVLKRLDQAVSDGDRIYSIIRGMGSTCGGGIDTPVPTEDAYTRSMGAALAEAGIALEQIGLMTLHGSGIPAEDRLELTAVGQMLSQRPPGDRSSFALGSVTPIIGHAGAAAGLASAVGACLAIHRQTIPPLAGCRTSEPEPLPHPSVYMPCHARHWGQNRSAGPRTASVSALSGDGSCMHVILGEAETPDKTGPHADRPPFQAPAAGDHAVDATPMIVRQTGGPPWPKPMAAPAPSMDPTTRVEPLPETDVNPPFSGLMAGFSAATAATADAHERFLHLSGQLTGATAAAFDLQTRLMAELGNAGAPVPGNPVPETAPEMPVSIKGPQPVFDRAMCMEFAIGSVEKMLGPDFAVVDTFKTRVRLPDEPLMLVDRIMSLTAQPLSMGAGQVVTEHDVNPGAWYLDGDRAPVCIAVEAGQADLFLCAYLGIDHQVRGERSYRLLDARVKFHRSLPRPGETIRYDIRIDKFVRQNQTWLFFFSFEGTIDGRPMITMTDGCAGFFTPQEVDRSGGIILTAEEMAPESGKCPPNWHAPVPLAPAAYDENALRALRRGDAGACFGPLFDGIVLPAAQQLPDGRMKLIDRVVDLDPTGGRYGLGSVCAEADIRPDDWFLTCHFMDDMVMPGTLMYECCAHTLRIFFQRLGWVTDHPDACFEPVVGVSATLKCRGPVTPETKKVVYTVEIKEIGYGPAPFVVADAHMSADGRPIVMFRDMSLQLSGADRKTIDDFWQSRSLEPKTPAAEIYDYRRILAFCVGAPSEAFGEPYRIFDDTRRIARLPGPPYLFMDRVVAVEPEPWVLKPGGWIEAQYDVPPEAWYFTADGSRHMPFCVLLEIALQPCGWLAAYLGSALHSSTDLKFRNLGGAAQLHERVGPETGTLTMRARLTRVAEAGEMIIEDFDFQVFARRRMIYEGTTNFGFFTESALSQQKGIRDADQRAFRPDAENNVGTLVVIPRTAPLTPADTANDARPPLTLPARALSMIDRVDCFLPRGGPHGLGYVRGVKQVDPDDWFFAAHFYQDPVCPGSLGIESLIQLVKFMALEKWPHLTQSHRFEPVAGTSHEWVYRGQVIPASQKITVSAVVTEEDAGPSPLLLADGWLQVDGLYIYEMKGFGVRLVAV